MSATLDVACPNCGKPLKVPAELAGKRVKCKGCDEVFAVPAPKAAKPAPKPAAKAPPAAKPVPAAKPAPPPPEPAKPKRPFEDDDDGPAKPIGVLTDDELPRCPSCAKDLDPPDAEVCLNCGFNNRTRIKVESKRLIAHDASDWLSHLGPGILALVIAGGLIGWNIYAGVNMRDWMEGSFLELDEKDIANRKKMIIPPGAFITLSGAISLVVVIPAIRFVIRRLILDPTPPEKVKK